jgi:hypothetical protein
MNPTVVYSIRHLAARLDRDYRTVAARLQKLGIEPFAISIIGEPFYSEDTLSRLEAAELEPQEAVAP